MSFTLFYGLCHVGFFPELVPLFQGALLRILVHLKSNGRSQEEALCLHWHLSIPEAT